MALDVTEREALAAERDRLYSVQAEVTQSLITQNDRLRELIHMKNDLVTVSQELRARTTAIRGMVELLIDPSSELSEGEVRMLRTIARNAVELQHVADDLLTDPEVGKGLKDAFTEFDLVPLVAAALDAVHTPAAAAGVVVALKPHAGPVTIQGDRARLGQLMGNLLSNAIKFSPRGGRVHVIVDTQDHYAWVQILDEGRGIPAGSANVSSTGSTAPRFRTAAACVWRDSAWHSPSRLPRRTRASSTSSTRLAGPLTSGSSSRRADPIVFSGTFWRSTDANGVQVKGQFR